MLARGIRLPFVDEIVVGFFFLRTSASFKIPLSFNLLVNIFLFFQSNIPSCIFYHFLIHNLARGKVMYL